MSARLVAARDVDSGEISVHQSSGQAGYDTICGVSLSDDIFEAWVVPIGGRIDCKTCKSIWLDCRNLRAADFA